MIKGQVISGEFGKIVVRQKTGSVIEMGELLVAESAGKKVIMQAFDLSFASQISQQNLELISGLKLEEDIEMQFLDNLKSYQLAFLKPLVIAAGKNMQLCKSMPEFFSYVREITKEDLSFLTKPKNPLFLGNIRSGSKIIDVPVYLEGDKVLSHHVLIPGTTGKGKSVLMSNILWHLVDKDYCGMLVLDPHDEYYGKNREGLKDHADKNKVIYYTPKNAPPGTNTLKINIGVIKPWHFNGVMNWSEPQYEALSAYYKKYNDEWISAIINEKELDVDFNEATIGVVKRRLLSLLDLSFFNGNIASNGVFDFTAGETTIKDIVHHLESAKTVIIDTSSFAGNVELLIGSLIANDIFNRYKKYKLSGEIEKQPVISIVLEEAPRVLGKEAVEQGNNIFLQIAREGRKFRVGLVAITQLPSLIPRTILANINTKIIMGTEMAPERAAIIDSAAQDLSTDNRAIASLDVGEAIVSSNFARFAIPIKVPDFNAVAKQQKKEAKRDFRDFQ